MITVRFIRHDSQDEHPVHPASEGHRIQCDHRNATHVIAPQHQSKISPTFLAPARRTMSTICRIVVPRTIESSTSSTLRPSNTAGMAFSFRRTESSRRFYGATEGCGEGSIHPLTTRGATRRQDISAEVQHMFSGCSTD